MAFETDTTGTETPQRSERIGVVEMAQRSRKSPAPPQRSIEAPVSPQPFYPEPTGLQVATAAFIALGYALSARALLLLSLIGMIILTVMTLVIGTMFSLYALGVYGVLTVLPTTILEIRKRGP